MPIIATVADVLDWYDANEIQTYSPTATRERARLRGLFRSHCAKAIEECRPGDLLEFIAKQKGAKSNWTRRRIKATINRPFNLAAELGVIPRNPFRGLRIPEGKSGRDWTNEEYRAILRHASAHFRRLVIFIKFGGARPGEGRTLLWCEVRREVGAIIQQQHKTSWANVGPRRIHFNSVLLKLILWLYRNRGRSPNVFLNARGRPWSTQALDKHMRMVRDRAQIPDDVKLHGGRHTFGTQAIVNGVDLVTLAELLGHRSVKTTEKYVHLANKRTHLNGAMERAIGRVGGGRNGSSSADYKT